MTARFPATHAALLGIILAVSGYIAWSAVSASAKLDNLVVVAPVGAAMLVLAVAVIVSALRRPAADPTEVAPVWGDLLLLAGFAVFCYALTHVGFDVATFLFVWGGVVASGGKGWWQPPLFAALFTLLLVEAFGSLFPYPMLTLVL
ncbi:tripartite tricarboxylate transporter TctB family protein (plasmid) [Salipiger sp. H15]|uniref:Tripartite tricarboxylate transporter TctB family protein n=1 Tax=Alloyangia sp. H15 TaxID=3029062 RepID=A0AAU8AQX9_9RHOB